ncbi:membrane associated rhomboid family serine protease [Aminobacter lissarensis]|uniref:Membrane associated rhomboid family serine protease n=1 Tax=Aminobacter carboxidus TaxID=376165 RepID=A0A8E2BC74_9HYPH|nr:rhomboid family intramembrane serine protease [Aminobacter lissarensis]MBB6466628.1 membrane associated rhomboid family serine protease [Aminobacter lissarensis]
MSEPASPTDNTDEIVDAVPERREPMFNLPGIVIAIIGACVAMHLSRVYILSPDQDFALLVRTAFIPVRYSGQYALEIWAFTSPLTYAFLHGGFAHLIINMVWLAAFGSPLANRLGNIRFSAFFAVTTLAAVALHYVLHSNDAAPLVGASGAISGMMGAAARFSFQVDRSQGKPAFAGAPLPIRDVFRSRTALTFLGVWMVINLVTGLVGLTPGDDSQIAWEAHIGGFLAGFLGIRFFDRRREFA